MEEQNIIKISVANYYGISKVYIVLMKAETMSYIYVYFYLYMYYYLFFFFVEVWSMIQINYDMSLW